MGILLCIGIWCIRFVVILMSYLSLYAMLVCSIGGVFCFVSELNNKLLGVQFFIIGHLLLYKAIIDHH